MWRTTLTLEREAAFRLNQLVSIGAASPLDRDLFPPGAASHCDVSGPFVCFCFIEVFAVSALVAPARPEPPWVVSRGQHDQGLEEATGHLIQ